MQRLFIAVGELPQGGVTGLYVGQDADAALRAIEEAGKAGKINCGFFIRNPSVSRRISFVRTPEEVAAGQTNATRSADAAVQALAVQALATKAGKAAVAAVKQVITEAAKPSAVATPVVPAVSASQASSSDETTEDNHFGLGAHARRR
jgi:hypothetical protein